MLDFFTSPEEILSKDSTVQGNAPYQKAANDLSEDQKQFMENFKNRSMPKNKAIRSFVKGCISYYSSLREDLRLSALFRIVIEALERNGYICDYSYYTANGVPYIDLQSVTFLTGKTVFSVSQLPVAAFLDLYHEVDFNGRKIVYRVLNAFLDYISSFTGWRFDYKYDNDCCNHTFGKRDIVSFSFYGVEYDMRNDDLFWFVDQLCDGSL